jgi:uncharacterized membrane protein
MAHPMTDLPHGVRRPDAVALLVVTAWTALAFGRAVAGHLSLATNAFDLSVFDYALWGVLHGRAGFVPFLAQSIFSQHFMPVLFVLAPVYALAESPVLLMGIQVVATAGAGWLCYRFAVAQGVARLPALALLAVFLLSRRTHSAATSFFYPECLQALLTLAVVACWRRPAWAYWSCAVLLLATKEDAGLYLGAFAVLQWVWPLVPDARPRRAIATAVVAALWMALALGWAIPASRARDGLDTVNPFVASRFASSDGALDARALASRVVSRHSLATLGDLAAGTGLLPLAAPIWLLPAVPGLVLGFAAKPGTMQAAVIGHYAWPVLPWLFLSAAVGLARLQRRSRRLAVFWSLLLLAGTLVDSPTVRGIPATRIDPDARTVRRQLAALPSVNGIVVAQPDLIPHLAHRLTIFSAGGVAPAQPPALVLLTPVGDLWPFDRDQVLAMIDRYSRDPAYEEIASGPLYAFARRPQHGGGEGR